MKTRETTPGKTYSVHTSSGCTVSDKNGWSKAIDAPDGYFTAHAGEVTIDGDDAADVREVFKLAPQQKLALLGVLGGGVPAWKLKYAECTNIEDMYAVNPDFKTDLTSDGEWVYALPEMVNFGQRYPSGFYADAGLSEKDSFNLVRCVLSMPKNQNNDSIFRQCKKLKYLKLSTPVAIACDAMVFDSNALEELDFYAPLGQSSSNGVMNGLPNLRKAKIVMPNATIFTSSYPKLEELEMEWSGIRMNISQGFKNSILNAPSVIKLFNSFPTITQTDKTFTIGIHVDHQTNDEVLTAIANAESKGFNLVVQWNGTPTAQAATTYGLRKPPIYAKVSEMERPDGTTERVLEWGHYVTDPENYEEFRSVEAAREYFGLPDESLTNK